MFLGEATMGQTRCNGGLLKFEVRVYMRTCRDRYTRYTK